MKPIAPQTKRRLETLFTVLIGVVAPIMGTSINPDLLTLELP